MHYQPRSAQGTAHTVPGDAQVVPSILQASMEDPQLPSGEHLSAGSWKVGGKPVLRVSRRGCPGSLLKSSHLLWLQGKSRSPVQHPTRLCLLCFWHSAGLLSLRGYSRGCFEMFGIDQAGRGPQGPRHTHSPTGMLSPSFCQEMVGKGMPTASQGRRTSSVATARTSLGSGFTMGEAVKKTTVGDWGCLYPQDPKRGPSGNLGDGGHTGRPDRAFSSLPKNSVR